MTPWLRERPWAAALVPAAWLAVAASILFTTWSDQRLGELSRNDLRLFGGEGTAFLVAMCCSLIVGSALGLRRPSHPVGWLFLGLGLSISLAGAADALSAHSIASNQSASSFGSIVAVLSDRVFIPWIATLTLIMLLTPSGRFASTPMRILGWVAMLSGAIGFSVGLFTTYRGVDASLGLIDNPLAVEAFAPILKWLGLAAVIVLHIALLLTLIGVVVRFKRSGRNGEPKLRWLALAAIPFALLVAAAFIAALTGQEFVLSLAAGAFLGIVPIAAGLAIEQDRLYDIDRLISRGLSYALLSVLVVGVYAVVVVFVGETLGGLGGAGRVQAVIATLAAVSIAAPARRYLQDGIDRRFNRRSFEAVATVQRFIRDPSPAVSLEDVLRTATGDPMLAVACWIEDRAVWVTAGGEPDAADEPFVEVARNGVPLARICFNPARADRKVVEAASIAGLSELENVRLRAAIALQLLEVRESRARIVAAQLAERQRIERNLHDGAQQRLLALALQLRAAELSNDGGQARAALSPAIRQLQAAVRELRELASGLGPAALVEGGLGAAFDELAARTPVPVRLDTTGERFSPRVEESAWFIACEAVANAVKHAHPHAVEISARKEGGHLRLRIEDDGVGGADPGGRGLRGIAERAEAAGGRLTVTERPGHGTIVLAELPCAL